MALPRLDAGGEVQSEQILFRAGCPSAALVAGDEGLCVLDCGVDDWTDCGGELCFDGGECGADDGSEIE